MRQCFSWLFSTNVHETRKADFDTLRRLVAANHHVEAVFEYYRLCGLYPDRAEAIFEIINCIYMHCLNQVNEAINKSDSGKALRLAKAFLAAFPDDRIAKSLLRTIQPDAKVDEKSSLDRRAVLESAFAVLCPSEKTVEAGPGV